jgi:LysR family hca operon transcriptional activator
MELRHLRYFVAVAEEGNLTAAAERRLFTAQPSLSRQLRDLEQEVGTELLVRSARGVQLTPAGRAFLDHARLALGQAAEAVAAARRAARPPKATFTVGFIHGQEVDWLPRVMQVLSSDLLHIDFKVTSLYSPQLADALERGDVDLGFLRKEPRQNVTYQVIAREPIVAILPSDHRLARQKSIGPRDLQGEPFIGFSDVPHVLRDVVDRYFRTHGVKVKIGQILDNAPMGISLVASTRSITMLPTYVEPLLPWSVVSRPMKGEQPAIELAVGYRADNRSEVLKKFLKSIEWLIDAGPAGLRERPA